MDTVRADHLPCYGYQIPTASNVCALADQGVLFTNAISQSSWTLPAHASMLTGLYPHQHRGETRYTRVDDDARRLAGILKREGYATGAIVSARVVGANHGLERGFSYFDSSLIQKGIHTRFAADISDKAIAWLDQQDDPFFLWLHYYDPHHVFLHHANGFPYTVPDIENLELDYTGWNRSPSKILKYVRQHSKAFLSLYDGEIYFTDLQIGRLFEHLRRSGRYDRTLVVVTSDHGESFGEHRLVGHDNVLYQELIRVPLIIRAPGQEGPRVIDTLQETRNIFHTVLSVLGVESESGPGHNLLTDTREYAYSEVHNKNSVKRVAVNHENWKLVYAFDATVELYDLSQDPAEKSNVAEENPQIVRGLMERLSEDMGVVVMDEEALEQLRALGYVN